MLRVTTRWWGAPALFIVGALASAGCSAGATHENEPSAASIVGSPATAVTWMSVDAASLPLGWFLSTEVTTRRLLAAAQAQLSERCLTSHGYDVVLPVLPQPLVPHLAVRYGVTSIAQARAYGYRDPEGVESAAAGDALLKDSPLPGDAAFLLALNGPQQTAAPVTAADSGEVIASVEPLGGCSGQAAAELFGTASDSARYVALNVWLQNVERDTLVAARNDGAVVAAARSWHECMQSDGYDFTDPTVPSSKPWPDADLEQEVALADVACRETSGYTTALIAADARLQQSFVEKNSDVLRRYQQLEDAAVEAASQLVAGEG